MLKRFREFIFIIVSSVLLVLPFHFSFLWPLAYIAFIPYFFALENKSQTEAFRKSYILGIFFFMWLGYWLARVNVFGFILLAAYLALYFALFGMMSAPFLESSDDSDKFNFRRAVTVCIFIASFWVALEYVRGWALGGFPWALLAYSQWRNIVPIQIADITGCYGVSFFVLLVNLFLFQIARVFITRTRAATPLEQQTTRDRTLLRLSVSLAVLLLLVLGYGWMSLIWRDGFYKNVQNKRQLHVSVVQGDIPQDQKWDVRIKNIIFEKYKRLTLMSALERSDLIVWPETSFPGFLEDEPVMAAQLRNLVRHSMTNVLVGAPTLGDLDEGLKFYNSALLYSPAGEELRRYSKVHLVPFGEYIPFELVLGALRHFVTIGHFSPGKDKTIFRMETRYQRTKLPVNFGVLICYEDIFPGLVRDFCKDGADFLVNITNDAWFGNTSAPYQHAAASVFRAVENRVPVVRSTNTGLSCFISAEGRILSSVKEDGKEIFITGHQGQDLILRKSTTFYTHFGDVFMLLVFISCFFAYRDRSKHQPYTRL